MRISSSFSSFLIHSCSNLSSGSNCLGLEFLNSGLCFHFCELHWTSVSTVQFCYITCPHFRINKRVLPFISERIIKSIHFMTENLVILALFLDINEIQHVKCCTIYITLVDHWAPYRSLQNISVSANYSVVSLHGYLKKIFETMKGFSFSQVFITLWSLRWKEF